MAKWVSNDGLSRFLDKCKTIFANKTHTHTKSQITDFPTSMPASDVYSWAKASAKPTYTASEVGARASTWTPTKSDIGLGNVDNTSDSNKSVKYATSAGSVTGSNKVIVSSTAPTDTSAIWIV